MSDLDERFDLERSRDLRGRRAHPWVRRAFLSLLAVPVLLAAVGVFGQRTSTVSAQGPKAKLSLEAPDALRGGLLWHARIVLHASDAIEAPRLLLGPGFFEGMQVDTIEPGAATEATRGGRLVLTYDRMKPGDSLVVYLQFQVDPTTTGMQNASVELDDATDPLARVEHTIVVFP